MTVRILQIETAVAPGDDFDFEPQWPSSQRTFASTDVEEDSVSRAALVEGGHCKGVVDRHRSVVDSKVDKPLEQRGPLARGAAADVVGGLREDDWFRETASGGLDLS